MSPVIARSLKMQRLLFQSSMSFAVAHASKPEEFLDELSEKLWDKPPVISFSDNSSKNSSGLEAWATAKLIDD